MLRNFFVAAIVLLSTIIGQTQTIYPSYYFNNEMEYATPGTMLFGLGGYNNPAELTFQPQPNIYFTWNDKNADVTNFSNWGLFTSIPYLGFGVHKQSFDNYSMTDYKISTAIGTDAFGFGIGYGWSSGDVNIFDRSDLFTLGAIYRPADFLSLNFITNLLTKGAREGIIGAGLRPFTNYSFTLFGDYTFTNDKVVENKKWSAGAIVEPLDGLRIIGRYYDGKSFNVGLQLGFGVFGFSTVGHFDENAKRSFNTYGIRVGANDRNLLRIFSGNSNYVSINLQGVIKYQNFKLFDNSKTLFNLLEQLDAVIYDNSVSGIAINLSGANINKEMFWELREKLKEIKSYGKKVYVYLDRAGMNEYHFASVADKIILDPMGTVSLEGFLMGRTFFNGSLEMLGLG
ncbi:MAG TPA: S49 family peptidase, partial [Ignavibacteriaceae bacterium]